MRTSRKTGTDRMNVLRLATAASRTLSGEGITLCCSGEKAARVKPVQACGHAGMLMDLQIRF